MSNAEAYDESVKDNFAKPWLSTFNVRDIRFLETTAYLYASRHVFRFFSVTSISTGILDDFKLRNFN